MLCSGGEEDKDVNTSRIHVVVVRQARTVATLIPIFTEVVSSEHTSLNRQSTAVTDVTHNYTVQVPHTTQLSVTQTHTVTLSHCPSQASTAMINFELVLRRHSQLLIHDQQIQARVYNIKHCTQLDRRTVMSATTPDCLDVESYQAGTVGAGPLTKMTCLLLMAQCLADRETSVDWL